MPAKTFTDPAERGKAFGVYGAIAGAGGAVGLLVGGLLTEYLSWRWCLNVNVVLAVVAVAGAVRLLASHPRDPDVRIDSPGTVLVAAGLVAVVYGLSEADTKGWGAPTTVVLLAAGVVLLAAFVLVEMRVAHPLLPLRIVLDRLRGGAYLAIGLSAIGVFGIFLFLAYYLQLTLAYSPVKSGLAFLPMIAAIVAASTTSSGMLMPRFGPRPLILAGLLIAAGGLAILAARLGLHTSYPDWILPALLLVGAGLAWCSAARPRRGWDPQPARAAAVVLGKDRGFHVRLDGPAERRIVQRAVIEGITQEQARERLCAADKARTAYVRRLYRTDPADASLYHLVLDSTAIPLDTVIELIITAARAHSAAPQGATARSSPAPGSDAPG